MLKKISTCYNNPELSSTTKINQHVPSGYSIFTNCTFDKSYNKLSYYKGEDCMKRFCKDLRDHATRIIDFKKKFIIPLTKHKIPKNIPIIFHNGSKYDYHFIIRELASEFEGNFECLGENTEK